MQKKVIISVVAINVFIMLTVFVLMSDKDKIENQMNNLNDNQIRIYNEIGITLDQMEAIKNVDGVKNVTFNNRNIFPSYAITAENNSLVSITGMTIESDNEYQKKLDYIAGSYLTAKYQVVITKSLADELISEGIGSDYKSLIGKDLVNGLKIVGVYPDPNYAQIESTQYMEDTELVDNKYVVPTRKSFTNSFMLFNAGAPYDQLGPINIHNDRIAYKYEADTQDYDTYVFDEERYDIDYKKSIANGAKNLIDPKTTEYGKTFNQFATINTGENRDAVVSSLKSILPDAAIVTSDTKLGDMINTKSMWLRVGLYAILLELLIIIPTIKNGKKRR